MSKTPKAPVHAASGGSSSLYRQIRENLFLLCIASGVLISFTIFGYAQEALTRGEYGGERFKFPTFLIVVSAFSNLVVASVVLLVTGDRRWSAGASSKDWGIVSSAYLGAHFCGLAALQFIPFPMQVVCKSCKAVPVMIGERIFAKKSHSIEKKLQVLLMTAGVVIFTLFGGRKAGKEGGERSEWDLTPTLALGLALVVGALICDGIYGPYQNTIEKKYQANAFHLMFNMNLYELGMATVLCVFLGEMQGALAFCAKHPQILPNLVYFACTMSLGSVFIFQMQKQFGALTVTLTTTLRKLISVVFSVLWFGHTLQPVQWVATLVVFGAKPLADNLVSLLGLKTAKMPKK